MHIFSKKIHTIKHCSCCLVNQPLVHRNMLPNQNIHTNRAGHNNGNYDIPLHPPPPSYHPPLASVAAIQYFTLPPLFRSDSIGLRRTPSDSDRTPPDSVGFRSDSTGLRRTPIGLHRTPSDSHRIPSDFHQTPSDSNESNGICHDLWALIECGAVFVVVYQII